jgi:hypothetical protein
LEGCFLKPIESIAITRSNGTADRVFLSITLQAD